MAIRETLSVNDIRTAIRELTARAELARRPPGADRSARFLRSFVDFVISLYATHDFHTFPASVEEAQAV